MLRKVTGQRAEELQLNVSIANTALNSNTEDTKLLQEGLQLPDSLMRTTHDKVIRVLSHDGMNIQNRIAEVNRIRNSSSKIANQHHDKARASEDYYEDMITSYSEDFSYYEDPLDTSGDIDVRSQVSIVCRVFK